MDDDKIELTVTINSDTFPLLWEALMRVQAGRRRAGALKRAAESFLLLQKQSAQAVLTHTSDVEKSQPSSQFQSSPADRPIDPHSVRESLGQFGFD
ncbi:hypothetical protein [Paraburkholderia dioscoreae]|uniref:Uncharacterized protein n=1 Tax=Paraburkholderia dioscoreae TaxID=2604047 RepID=A0A5Q4YYD3_9BURK|nr:hypothetical protein [Paraburkholderia dioscoreae]VVD33794.1 protein of unknown function [Paraburkholderia dioscoreae]